jgi:hypothetical protein
MKNKKKLLQSKNKIDRDRKRSLFFFIFSIVTQKKLIKKSQKNNSK